MTTKHDDGLIPVKLLKPHTDRGRDLKPGETVRLRQDQIGRLAVDGVVEQPTAAPAPVSQSPLPAPVPARGKQPKED